MVKSKANCWICNTHTHIYIYIYIYIYISKHFYVYIRRQYLIPLNINKITFSYKFHYKKKMFNYNLLMKVKKSYFEIKKSIC
jgi:hypothetical protein